MMSKEITGIILIILLIFVFFALLSRITSIMNDFKSFLKAYPDGYFECGYYCRDIDGKQVIYGNVDTGWKPR